MNDAYICDAIRTPIGRYGGALKDVRADDLGAVPIKALIQRNPGVDWRAVDDVIYGCANQAGEDNRNVARMSALLAGLPADAPGATINRLCGSGMDASRLCVCLAGSRCRGRPAPRSALVADAMVVLGHRHASHSLGGPADSHFQ